MTTRNAIRFETDPIGQVDWAHFPDSIFSLARFNSGTVLLVANATKPDGKFIPITNPDYDHAGTVSEFRELANRYHRETTE